MGIEIVLGVASLAVGVIGGVNASNNARRAQAAQREANNISIAQTRVEAAERRRQLLREERIRRARLQQGSENAGAGGSSGEAGAMSAMTTNVDTITSASLGATKAAEGINTWQQKAVDFEQRARDALMWSDVFQSGINTFGNIKFD